MNDNLEASCERGESTCDAEMLPNVTECYVAAERLNDRQLVALRMMIAGKSDSEITQAVGVHRQTLWRWRQHDDDFRAELQRQRRIVCDEAADRFRALLAPALDVMEEQLHDEYDLSRVRAAIAVLRVSNIRELTRVKDDRPAAT